MKYPTIVNLLILFFSFIYSSVNAQYQKQFGDNYCKPEEIPMLVFGGDQVAILCDSAFIVNKHRMKLYEISKEMILKNPNQNFSKLIQAYDRTLLVVSSSYDSLLYNYRMLDNLFRKSMDDQKLILTNTQKDLEKATTNLNNTEKALNEAVAKLDERDKNGWKKKSMFFGGGLLTGILLMLIIQ